MKNKTVFDVLRNIYLCYKILEKIPEILNLLNMLTQYI